MMDDNQLSEEHIRLEALKCAVELGTQKIAAFDKDDEIVRRAIRFEEYIVLGKDVGAQK